jgi:hypothetical protein
LNLTRTGECAENAAPWRLQRFPVTTLLVSINSRPVLARIAESAARATSVPS